jgi:two-component system, response regulator RegA
VRRILLVDDSDSNRLVLGSLLEDEGHEVVPAASFAQARERLATHGGAFDIVMVDQHLGDGLGSNLVPLVRQHAPGAKVMLISGSADEDVASDAVFDAMVPKGRDFNDVLALMHELLSQQRPGGGTP